MSLTRFIVLFLLPHVFMAQRDFTLGSRETDVKVFLVRRYVSTTLLTELVLFAISCIVRFVYFFVRTLAADFIHIAYVPYLS